MQFSKRILTNSKFSEKCWKKSTKLIMIGKLFFFSPCFCPHLNYFLGHTVTTLPFLVYGIGCSHAPLSDFDYCFSRMLWNRHINTRMDTTDLTESNRLKRKGINREQYAYFLKGVINPSIHSFVPLQYSFKTQNDRWRNFFGNNIIWWQTVVC